MRYNQFVTMPLLPSNIFHAYYMKFHATKSVDANIFPLLKDNYGIVTSKYPDVPLNEP